jgi:hypothetical protein
LKVETQEATDGFVAGVLQAKRLEVFLALTDLWELLLHTQGHSLLPLAQQLTPLPDVLLLAIVAWS